MYRKYSPANLKRFEELKDRYKGHEVSWLRQMRAKYEPEDASDCSYTTEELDSDVDTKVTPLLGGDEVVELGEDALEIRLDFLRPRSLVVLDLPLLGLPHLLHASGDTSRRLQRLPAPHERLLAHASGICLGPLIAAEA